MPNPDRRLIAAALLGAAAGSRTFTPEAVLVARGRLAAGSQVRTAIIVAAAGELIGDKLPFVPARTEPLPYLGRIASGGFCGRLVAAGGGTLAGAAASAASTLIGYRARKAASARIPALLAALIEDALAIGAANLAVTLSAD